MSIHFNVHHGKVGCSDPKLKSLNSKLGPYPELHETKHAARRVTLHSVRGSGRWCHVPREQCFDPSSAVHVQSVKESVFENISVSRYLQSAVQIMTSKRPWAVLSAIVICN